MREQIDKNAPGGQPMHSQHIIGVDIGGTKLLGVVMTADAQVLVRRRAAAPAGNPALEDAVLQLINALLLSAAEMGIHPAGIGLGAPGFIDTRRGVVIEAENLRVSNLHLRQTVAQRFGLPACLFHDVKSAALAEARFGAGKGLRNFAFLNLGTGVSAGLFLEGKIYPGAAGVSGEIGHIWVRPPLEYGWAPNGDYLEALASGPALVRRALSALQQGAPSQITSLAGKDPQHITPETIGEAARAGDALAQRLIAETAEILGTAVAGVIDLLDLECVIVGGGVAQMGKVLLDPLQAAVNRYAIQGCRPAVPLLPGKLGGDAGAIGAATFFLMEAETC